MNNGKANLNEKTILFFHSSEEAIISTTISSLVSSGFKKESINIINLKEKISPVLTLFEGGHSLIPPESAYDYLIIEAATNLGFLPLEINPKDLYAEIITQAKNRYNQITILIFGNIACAIELLTYNSQIEEAYYVMVNYSEAAEQIENKIVALEQFKPFIDARRVFVNFNDFYSSNPFQLTRLQHTVQQPPKPKRSFSQKLLAPFSGKEDKKA